jgi:hypothetical protein
MMNGKFHGQGIAKWIVIRGQLRGHNDMPCRWPTPSRPSGRLGVGRPQELFGGLSYYQLVITFLNMVPLIMEFTYKMQSLLRHQHENFEPVLGFVEVRK